MFPIHFKLTIGTPEELARITAFIAGDYTATVAAAPRLDQPKAEAPGKRSVAATARSQPTAEAGPTAASSAAAPVTYPDLQKAVLTLHKMDPAAAVPIAKSLGADTFKALPEDKWAEAHRLVTEAIEARKVA